MHDAITIGVPVLAILFGILLNQRGIEKLTERMDKLETKVDERIGTLETKVDERIGKLETRVDARLTHMESRIDRIQADLAQFYRILGEHGAKIDNIEKR